jgi:hypothetical protein
MEFPFQWKIAESGYQFHTVDGRLWLATQEPTTWTLYQPLKRYTGLYRGFMGLQTQEEILGFANKYGRLGVPGTDGPLTTESGSVIFPESVADWGYEVAMMRSAVMVWDALQRADHKYLKSVIHWKRKPKRILFKDFFYTGKIKDTRPDDSQVKFGELNWPASRYIQDRINDALRDNVAPRMLWDESNELKLYHVPKTLLGAMWLQFADAVSYNLEYRACNWCGKSFEVTRSTRSDRLYCSNSCRVSASRKRTRLAKRNKS